MVDWACNSGIITVAPLIGSWISILSPSFPQLLKTLILVVFFAGHFFVLIGCHGFATQFNRLFSSCVLGVLMQLRYIDNEGLASVVSIYSLGLSPCLSYLPVLNRP